MTPEQLKASILQYAIQGKLVEQKPEEGTGEELYRQIQAEKQRLIKEGKIKKEKPLAEIIDDEIPFDIPESWKWCRITDCGVFISGYTPKPTDLTSEGAVPYFKVSDMNTEGNELFLNYTENYLKSSNPKCFLKNTIVYPKNGGAVFTNKKRILSKNSVVDLNTGGYYPIEPIDLMFVYIFFSNIDFRKCYKGTALPTIDMDRLKSKLFPLPPLAEQKRIVAKIEELLPYVDRYATAYEKLEQFNAKFPEDMKKSILQYAIQGKLVEQRPEEGTGEDIFKQLKPYHKGIKPCKDELNFSSMDFDIPESWTMVELNQIFDFVDYRGKTPTKITSGVFLITASNIKQGYMDYTRKEYISFEEYKGRQSRGLTQNGDLLFTTEAPMGNAALCDLDECSCGQRIITFKEYTKEATLPALFMYFILSPQFQQQLLDNCTGTTAKGIKAEKLKHFLLPLPPYEEQKRIVAKLEEILPLCERLK